MTSRGKAAPKGSILVVEDDADVRVSLQDQLRDDGYTVTTAGDGEEAWTR